MVIVAAGAAVDAVIDKVVPQCRMATWSSTAATRCS